MSDYPAVNTYIKLIPPWESDLRLEVAAMQKQLKKQEEELGRLVFADSLLARKDKLLSQKDKQLQELYEQACQKDEEIEQLHKQLRETEVKVMCLRSCQSDELLKRAQEEIRSLKERLNNQASTIIQLQQDAREVQRLREKNEQLRERNEALNEVIANKDRELKRLHEVITERDRNIKQLYERNETLQEYVAEWEELLEE